MSDRTETPLTVSTDYTFAMIPEWVIDAGLSGQAIKVLAILGLYTWNDMRGGIASHHTIADRGKVSINTVRRAIDELIAAGAITSTPRFDGKRQTTNHYVIHRGVPTGGQGVVPTHGQGEVPTGGQQIQSNLEPEQEEPNLARSAPHDNMAWALIEAMGWNRDEVPETQWGRIHAAAKQLTAIDADPADVPRRAQIYQVNFRGATMTPNAIATNWPDLDQPRIPVSQRELEDAGEKMRRDAAFTELEQQLALEEL